MNSLWTHADRNNDKDYWIGPKRFQRDDGSYYHYLPSHGHEAIFTNFLPGMYGTPCSVVQAY